MLWFQRIGAGLSPETRGIAGLVAAMLVFTIMDAFAKDLMERNDPIMVIWARFTSQMALVLVIYAPNLRRILRTRYPVLQTARSFLHLFANVLFFTALSMMAMAEAVAVFETGPLLITVFAYLILKEQVGPRRWTAVVVGLLGALIIIRPGMDVFQWAALLPLGTAVCMALFQIIVRIIGTEDSMETSMVYAGAAGCIVMSMIVPFFWTTPTLADGIVLATFGWIGFVGHICLLYALGQAPASTLAPFNYTGFLWALMIGATVFGEIPDFWTLVGAAIILGAGIYVWHRERVRSHPAEGL
ncbi:MAG: DMT family transporter [Pseudomonadota bacterium]